MDEPLFGSRENNYRLFYLSSCAAVSSLVILITVTSYTAATAAHIGVLMNDMTEVIGDIRIMLPDVEDSLKLLKTICTHENFTKTYGHLCD